VEIIILFNIVIVDTDILIDAGHNIEHAIICLKQYEHQAISIITKMELIVGCRNKRELYNTEQFLYHFNVFNLNENISEKASNLLLQYRLSHGLLIADAFIAATAITLNYPLISKNQKDYRFITELNLLSYP